MGMLEVVMEDIMVGIMEVDSMVVMEDGITVGIMGVDSLVVLEDGIMAVLEDGIMVDGMEDTSVIMIFHVTIVRTVADSHITSGIRDEVQNEQNKTEAKTNPDFAGPFPCHYNQKTENTNDFVLHFLSFTRLGTRQSRNEHLTQGLEKLQLSSVFQISFIRMPQGIIYR